MEDTSQTSTTAEDRKWFVAQAPFMTEGIREQVAALKEETFIPILKVNNDKGITSKRNTKLLTFNYVFIRGNKKDIEEKLKKITRIHLLYHRPGVAPGKSYGNYERKPMVVNDREMVMFMKIVSLYQNGTPVADIQERELQKGDKVRIIDGPFKGIEGTLITSKGKKGGKVIVSLSKIVNVSTLDIEPQYIQVIQFADEKKHLYKMLDSFVIKAEHAWNKKLDGEELNEEEKNQMEIFLNNYDLQIESKNIEAKFQTLRFIAYAVLGIESQAAEMYRYLCESIMPKLSGARIKTFVNEHLRQYETFCTTKN